MQASTTYRKLTLVAQVAACGIVAWAAYDAQDDEGGGEARSGEQADAPRQHDLLGTGLLLLHRGKLQDVDGHSRREASVPNGLIRVCM